jgi:hypothetical protein
MKKQLIIYLLSGMVSCMAGEAEPLTLAGQNAAVSWSAETFLSRLRQKPDGTWCAVSATNGGCVVLFGPQGKELTAPVPKDFRVENLYYLSTDSAGGLWLFPSSGRNTAYHDGRDWQVYRPDESRGLRYHSKEIGFEAQLAKGENYRIGTPTDQYYPTFTRDGRILYQNEWRRVCYFDGKQWHAPYGNNEVGGSTAADHPFFHEGKVTVRVGGKCYQMPEHAWSKTVDDRDEPRPWQEIPAVPQPFSQHAPPRPAVTGLAGCPIPASEQAWQFNAEGWTWVGNATTLAISLGQDWLTIPIAGTPLAEAGRITEIVADPHGRWFFGHSDAPPHRYTVYQADRLTVQPGSATLGTVNRPFASLALAWQANRPAADLRLRYRVDDGPWSALGPCGPVEPGPVATKGRHRLQIELVGRHELIRSAPLNYDFEVDYDLQQIVAGLVAQLGANQFADRERAARELIRLGAPAQSQLTVAAASKDPEIRARATEILTAVRSKDTTIP